MDAEEQLEIWWQSLEPEARESLLASSDPEPPGWAIASAVANHVQLKQDADDDEPVDLQAQIATMLAEFLDAKRRTERA